MAYGIEAFDKEAELLESLPKSINLNKGITELEYRNRVAADFMRTVAKKISTQADLLDPK